MELIYALEPHPREITSAIFLAGPTPRSPDVPSWRSEAIALLERAGYSGTVYIPEPRSGVFGKGDYDDQLNWELAGLARADCILFWIPRDLKKLPGFTTNVEFGAHLRSGRLVLGAPADAPKLKYLRTLATQEKIPQAETLAETVALAVRVAGPGVERKGAECEIPAEIFRSEVFQSWYGAQKCARNELRGAKVVWVLKTGPERDWLFYWALHVEVYVAAEDRVKKNEVVLARPDIAAVVLYRGDEVALVREFRAAAANDECFVREPASGSSHAGMIDPRAVALEETREETGLHLAPERLRAIGKRQLMATMSAHKAHVFAVELTEEELARFKLEAGVPRGAGQGEITHVEVFTIDELLERELTDWSTLGMLLAAVNTRQSPAGVGGISGGGIGSGSGSSRL